MSCFVVCFQTGLLLFYIFAFKTRYPRPVTALPLYKRKMWLLVRPALQPITHGKSLRLHLTSSSFSSSNHFCCTFISFRLLSWRIHACISTDQPSMGICDEAQSTSCMEHCHTRMKGRSQRDCTSFKICPIWCIFKTGCNRGLLISKTEGCDSWALSLKRFKMS